MMNILTNEKWQRFKSDGKLFEKLIQDLLGAMYPNADFSHTSWSHDGGKDFECGFPFLDEEVKVWAECKYHMKALPIHEVSMTLCMAYIESASSILFFSYSPINSTFQKYIDLYKKKSDKIIKIYADSSLEALLIKYRNDYNFESYFGSLETVELTETHELSYKYWLHSSTKKSNSSIKLYLNDTITLEFSALNSCSEPVEFEMQMLYPKSGDCFQILDKEFVNHNLKCSLTAPPHGICGKTIQLKVKKYQPVLKLPYIKIQCDRETKTLRINKNLECRWIAETSIIGKKYQNIIKDWQDALSGLHNCFGVIAGHSGTGKSRVLQEIGLTGIYEGYTTISFDADNAHSLTALYFFRKLISEIEDIPWTFKMSQKNIKYLYECLKEKTIEYDFLFGILSNDGFDFYAIKDKLISYLIHILNKQDYLLILDNIQYYDEIILEILQCALESPDLQSRSKLIFAANLDYTYKDTKAEQLIRKIEWSAHHTPKKNIYIKVNGFKKEEAQEYLRNCLHYNPVNKTYDDFDYTLTMTEIVQTYGTNPLFLQNYLLYLLQEDIIARTDTSAFYIADCVKFKASISEIPKKLLELLSYREKALINYIMKHHIDNTDILQEKYNLFVTFLAFARWMPYKMIHKLTEISDDVIQEMINIGLLKTNSDGFLGFYHQQIEQYYKKFYPYTDLTEEALELFISTAMQQYNRSLYCESIFLAQYELNRVQSNIFFKIVDNILIQKLDYSKSYEICKAMSILLNNKIYEVPQHVYIALYENMTNICINRVGVSMTENIYENIYENFCHEYLCFTDYLSEVMYILQAYLRALLNLHKVKESLQKNDFIIKIINQHFQNNKDFTKVIIELYYLRIYAYNSLNDLKSALEMGDTCIELSQAIPDKKYLIQSWFTKGDIYYTYKLSYNYKGQIIECWNTAWEIYQNLEDKEHSINSDTAFYLNLLMRRTLIMLFENNKADAYENARELARYFDKTQMMYFEVKIRQLYVIVFLNFCQKGVIDEKKYFKLESIIKKCVDICAIYGNESLYLDCFHLLAILQRSYGNHTFSQDNYQKSFAIVWRILEHQFSVERWSYFLFDLVIAARKTNTEHLLPPRIWQLITDDELSDRLYQLVTIKKEAFDDYIDEQTPISLPYNPEMHIYFPKI